MTVVPNLQTSRAPVTSLPPGAPTLHADYTSGDVYLHAHTILIVIIFCTVCFLLLVAFFYAFCFHCTLRPSPKDGRQEPAFHLEREDATFRRTSSCSSHGNAI